MNKKVITIILGMALVATSGGVFCLRNNEVRALEQGQGSTSTTPSLGEDSSRDMTTSQVTVFSDVKDTYWAKKGITAAIERGYVSGYPGGIFKPEQAIKRNEFIKMVVTALKLPVENVGDTSTTSTTSTKSTASTASWYESYVKVAKQNKFYIDSDFADNDLGWNKIITRKEMARIAVRAGLEKEEKQDSKWMYVATKAGLITGLGKGELGEAKSTTRAQSVTIIERILAVKNKEKLPVDKYAVGSAEIAWHGTNIFTVMPEIMVTDEAQYKGKTIEELWRQDLMTITSRDGLYKGALDALIAIDLEDPNDPNLKQLPPVNDLKWFNNSSLTDGVPDVKNPVSKWKKSYVLYFKERNIFNKDTKKFADIFEGPPYGIRGLDAPDRDKFFLGTLNKPAHLWHKKWSDIPAMIVPKTGWVVGNSKISIHIDVPSTAGYLYQSNKILELDGPKS